MFALQDANEDAGTFRHPAHFDIARQENPHLAFSHGLHFCLGASVARMELQLPLRPAPRSVPPAAP